MIDEQADYLIYEFEYEVEGIKNYIIMILINLDRYGLQNEKNNIDLDNNLFGKTIGNRQKFSNFLGFNYSKEEYNKQLGGEIKKGLKKLQENNLLKFNGGKRATDLLFGIKKQRIT